MILDSSLFVFTLSFLFILSSIPSAQAVDVPKFGVFGAASSIIVFANLGVSANPDINSPVDATSYSNTIWTPPVTGMIILWVDSSFSTAPNIPTVSGNGITWVQIATVTFSARRLTLFASDATGAIAGITTISFAGQIQTSATASFFHVAGADEDAGLIQTFVQTPSATGSATSGSITLASAANSNNRPISAWTHKANEVTTPRVLWTEIDDLAHATPATGAETQFRSDSFETTASATWATNVDFIGIAAEIKVAPAINNCDVTRVILDSDCWALSSGGSSGFLPDSDDSLILDSNSGIISVNARQDGDLEYITTGSFTMTVGYTGSFTVNTSDAVVEFGSFVENGGTFRSLASPFGNNIFRVTGAFSLLGGVFQFDNGASLRVGGNWIQNVAFNSVNGCIIEILQLAPISVSGTNVDFSNCRLRIVGSSTISFLSDFITGYVTVESGLPTIALITAGKNWTIEDNSFDPYQIGNLADATGFRLKSSSAGVSWNLINVAGLSTFNVQVSDSIATIIVNACDNSNIDLDGNENWDFCVLIITDKIWLEIGVWLFFFAVLLVLYIRIAPLYGFLSGIVGLFFAFRMFIFIESVPLSMVVSGVSILIITTSFISFRKVKR